MNRFIVLAGTMILLVWPAFAVAKDTSSKEETKSPKSGLFRKGIALAVYGNYPYSTNEVETLLSRFRQLGINNVAVTIHLFQSDFQATDIGINPNLAPTRAWLSTFIKQAHQKGIAITLNPLLDEQNLQTSPRGRARIHPRNVEEWFRHYTAVLTYLAGIADQEKVRTLTIGIELESMMGYTQQWLKLIKQLRLSYRGELAYSVNWWQEVVRGRRPAFLKALDIIGISSYFPFGVTDNVSAQDLVVSFRSQWLKQVKRWMASYPQQQIVLAEVGIRPQQGALVTPWAWNHGTPIDLSVQSRYYAAYCQISKLLPVQGLFWWFVRYQPSQTLIESDISDFSPLGKPAEQEIKACWG